MAFCASCGGQMNGAICGVCGAPAGGGVGYQAPVAAKSSSEGLQDNVAACLCYLFIPAIVFLVMAPYNQKKFVRFHAFQSLFLTAFYIVLGFGMAIVLTMLAILIGSGFLMSLLGMALLAFRLLCFAFWLFLIYKAYNNEKFMIPGIGQLADKQA